MTSLQISDQNNQRCVTLPEIESFIDALPSSYTSPRTLPSKKKHLHWKTPTLIGIMLCTILIACLIITGTLQILVVLSGSMQPTLHAGDIIITQETPIQTLHINDIITYRSPENTKNLVTHRIVNIINDNHVLTFQTKGDANKDPDHYVVASDRIVGRMILIIPYAGYIAQISHSFIGYILLILTPGTIVICTEVIRIAKNVKIKNLLI